MTEAELAREPARSLANARTSSPEAIAAEVLLAVAREHLDADTCREVERSFWRTWAARKVHP